MAPGQKNKINARSPAPSLDPGEVVASSYAPPSGADCELAVIGMLVIDMYS